MFLVSHLRRTTQSDKNHEEGARVTLGQLRGSAAIAQLSDSVIALERNQQSGSKHDATTVRVLKNRYSGETGVACLLDYDLSTCKFNETEARRTSIHTIKLLGPNPPTPEMVKRAQFVDKTYVWNHPSVRPRKQRTAR